MKISVPPILVTVAALLLAGPASGQLVVLKSGQTAPAKNLRRDGATLFNTIDIAGRPAEVGYAITDVDHIELPEPVQLGQGEQAIITGKPAAAVTLLDPIVNAYYPLRDIKGVYWAQAALLKSAALENLGKRDEAAALLTLLSQYPLNPHVASIAKARLAGLLAQGGKSKAPQAIALADAIISTSEDPAVLGEAWLGKGRALYALSDYDNALDAFLHLTVFYDDNVASAAQALLGSGKCYLELKDPKRAARAFLDLQERYGTTPEATEAKNELQKGGAPMAAVVKQLQADKAESERKLQESSKT